MKIKRTVTTQQCPICKAQQPISVQTCSVCGAVLSGDPVTAPPRTISRTPVQPTKLPHPTTWEDGEDDLFEGALPVVPVRGVLVMCVALLLLGAGIIYLARRGDLGPGTAAVTLTADGTDAAQAGDSTTEAQPLFVTVTQAKIAALPSQATQTPAITQSPTKPRPTVPPTNTRPPSASPTEAPFVPPPTLDIATVTPLPPTPTLTPTRGPCVQKAKQGDTLSALAIRCGNYSPAVIQQILELNNLKDAGSLQVGQNIVIPWPTPTGGAPVAANNPESSTSAAVSMANAEPTLPPGQLWHVIKKGENAIIVAYKYNMTIKMLFDLNPEIHSSFSQCDYGQPAGGQTCTVALSEGQRVRVLVPLPTATPTFTPNGSETATPTPTATFNVPYLISPGNNMLFGTADRPVLRWSASDRLGPNQVYLIVLKDKTIDKTYRIPTRDMFYPVSDDIQPSDGKRHEFEWSVGIGIENAGVIPDATEYVTETRTFIWQGR